MRTVQSWTCELGYGADTMFHRTYFLFANENVLADGGWRIGRLLGLTSGFKIGMNSFCAVSAD